jgi:hypothetical protein
MLVKVYLNYRILRNKAKLLDQDLQDLYKLDFNFWWTNENDQLIKYSCLNNCLDKIICMQKFRYCHEQCKEAIDNIFCCEYCQRCGIIIPTA